MLNNFIFLFYVSFLLSLLKNGVTFNLLRKSSLISQQNTLLVSQRTSKLFVATDACKFLSRTSDTISKLIECGVGNKFAKNYEDEVVLSALQSMNDINRGSTLVFNREGVLRGIFTERDFITKIVDLEKPPSEIKLSEVMTPFDKLVLGN